MYPARDAPPPYFLLGMVVLLKRREIWSFLGSSQWFYAQVTTTTNYNARERRHFRFLGSDRVSDGITTGDKGMLDYG